MAAIETTRVKKLKSQDSSSTSYDAPTEDVKSGITLNQLDVYSLAHISSFLSWGERLSIQQVSKKCKWAMDSSWCYFKVFESNKEPVDLQGRRADDFRENYAMLHCAKYLKKYKKQENFPIGIKQFEVLRRDCRNLTYLEFSVFHYHKHYFFNAFTNMQKLKTIKIRLVKAEGCSDDDLTDTRIFESVTKNIEEISLIGYEFQICLGINFARILTGFKSLTSLRIERWTMNRSVIRVISQKRKLKHLSLAFSRFDPDDLDLKNFTSLESFDITGLMFKQEKRNGVLIDIVTHLKHLKSLNIAQFTKSEKSDIRYHCFDDTDAFNRAQFDSLLTLNISGTEGINLSSINAFLRNNEDLEFFNISDTDLGLEGIDFLYQCTIRRWHRAPVLRVLVNSKLFQETQEYLKYQSDNPYLIVESDFRKPQVFIPEAKHLPVRQRSNSSVGTDSIGG